MASEKEWQPLTAERFLREDAPRVELDSPTDKSQSDKYKPPISDTKVSGALNY